MSLAQIDARRAAIRTHLFLLCPNNSGSTYLGNAIKRSQHVWGFRPEGQHVFGFAGPHTQGHEHALIWGSTPETRAVFEDADYDWERTERAWYYHAEAARDDASVFFTKSPPFLLIAQQLRAHFRGTRFILMVRNPFAMMEGIVRRYDQLERFETRAELIKATAQHIVTCFEYQAKNRAAFADIACSFTYEELCAAPDAAAKKIAALVPVLDDLDLTQRLAVKGQYDERLRNMNADQIARLSDDDLAGAARVFAPHAELFEPHGYSIDPHTVRVTSLPDGE